MQERLYIGIDDTDNKYSRGTGYRSRKLAELLMLYKLAYVEGITRHQLFVHTDIPYTSQNSSACLVVSANNSTDIAQFCKEFLIKDSAKGSDVGLCITHESSISESITEWGNNAKIKVLTKKQAYQLATENGVFLKGLTGSKDGIIGALAAVGLRHSGNDGRFIWLPETDLREVKGVYKAQELLTLNIADCIITKDNNILNNNQGIYMGDWVRPLLNKNQKTIIVEKSENENNYEWQVASKDYIKSISS
jgi:tRNA(Ile2) C34 agmatinyltransferase TiaS